MKNYTTENPDFTNAISVPEVTDPAHADIISEAAKQVFRNTMYLKEKIAKSEQLINLKEFSLNQQITSEKNALSEEIVTKVSELEGRVNKKIADEKNALTGVITTKVSEAEGRVNKKIADEKKLLNKAINDETKKRFEELMGLANKTVALSADGNVITRTEGNITVTTKISESDKKTILTTVVQRGSEKYTKTSVLTEQSDGSVKIVTKYVKNS